MATSDAQRRANKANAKKSTGPRTDAGKARSKLNALTHGIFSAEVLVADGDGKEDAAALEALREEMRADLRPEGVLQEILVDRLVAVIWRWRRALRFETGATRAAVDGAVASWAARQQQTHDLMAQISTLVRPSKGPAAQRASEGWKSTERLEVELAMARGYVGALAPDDPLDAPNSCPRFALVAFLADRGDDPRKVLGLPKETDVLDAVDEITPKQVKRLFEAVLEPGESPRDCWKWLREWAAMRLQLAESHLDDRRRQEELLRTCATLPTGDVAKLMRYEAHLSREFARTLSQLSERQA